MPVLDLSPEKPKPGTLADANAISNAFTKIESVVNELDDSNFASGTPIDPSSISSGGAVAGDVLTWNGSVWVPGGGVPPGTIFPFAGAVVPNGYFLCDGAQKPKGTYGALYAALGGASSPYGQTTSDFQVPDIRGRVPVALDAGQGEFVSRNQKGGNKALQAHQHIINEHTHNMNHDHGSQMQMQLGDGNFFVRGAGGAVSDVGGGGAGSPIKNFFGNTGGVSDRFTNTVGTGDGQNLQPYIVLLYIIKY